MWLTLNWRGRGGALIRALDVIPGIRTRITAEKLKSWNCSCYLTSRVLPDFFRSVDSQYVFTGPQLNRKYSPISLSWFGPCRFFNVKRSEHLKTAISLNTVMIPVWIVVTLSGEWEFFHANDLFYCHSLYVQQRHLEVRSVWFYRPEVFVIILFLTSLSPPTSHAHF